MVNPIPNTWYNMRRQNTIRNDQRQNQNPQEAKQEQQYFVHSKTNMTPRVRAIVFDTMVDDTWQSAHESSSLGSSIRRQETIRYEDDLLQQQTPPKQHFIHSQHRTTSSSWTSNVKEFLGSPRTLQNDDDDALYWCE